MVLGLLAHVTPSIFFSKILRSEALVYNSYFFSEQLFYGNYLTLDSHTNTVISHAFAYSSRWRQTFAVWQPLKETVAPKLSCLHVFDQRVPFMFRFCQLLGIIINSCSETTHLPPEIILNVLKLLPRIFCWAKINQVDKSRLLQTSNVWSCNRRYLSYL